MTKQIKCDCCGKTISKRESYTLKASNSEHMITVDSLCQDCVDKVFQFVDDLAFGEDIDDSN